MRAAVLRLARQHDGIVLVALLRAAVAHLQAEEVEGALLELERQRVLELSTCNDPKSHTAAGGLAHPGQGADRLRDRSHGAARPRRCLMSQGKKRADARALAAHAAAELYTGYGMSEAEIAAALAMIPDLQRFLYTLARCAEKRGAEAFWQAHEEVPQ